MSTQMRTMCKSHATYNLAPHKFPEVSDDAEVGDEVCIHYQSSSTCRQYGVYPALTAVCNQNLMRKV